ncbi:ABC transporter ATP-binding protein [Candidatus Bathyarchaeota archaeon]|nr:ABC transporter ATP-binding protein [Candidatus Bathyarchaeota archaeon]MBS7628709.1 ABC transporter ATP-binding protein [Candidatus Bathyarchaeota archaeon]
MSFLLECIGLSKHFGDIPAVDDVTFKMQEKELKCVIGPNGAGKTTLLNLIAGLLKPEAGRIIFKGRDITGLSAYRRAQLGIARTFQLTTVFQKMNAYENLLIANSGGANILELAKTMGLDGKLDRKVSHLSYVDKKRLEIAMAVALNPTLLLLDEPFSGLSEDEIRELTVQIKDLAEKMTVLMIEHKISKVCDLAHRITVLNDGKIICDGKPDDVLNDPTVRKVYWKYE